MSEREKLLKCKDCGILFHELYCGDWCEECFETGLHKDMNDHFKRYIDQEMKELDSNTESGDLK